MTPPVDIFTLGAILIFTIIKISNESSTGRFISNQTLGCGRRKYQAIYGISESEARRPPSSEKDLIQSFGLAVSWV